MKSDVPNTTEAESIQAASDHPREYWRKRATLNAMSAQQLVPGTLEDAEFRILAGELPTLCWIANGDGYIVWYNRAWHEYCGTTPDQMEGWGWQSVHDPELLPSVLERWKASIASGDPFEMTFPLRGADGVFRPFLTRIKPVRDPSGRVLRWFGVNTEITDQIVAEGALRDERNRYRAVLDGMAEGFALLDHDFRILDINAEGMKLESRSLDELIGKCHWEAYPGSRESDLGRAYQRAMVQRAPVSLEHRYVWDDGREAWLDMRAYPVAEGLAIFYRDVSERKRAEETLRETSRRLDAILNNTRSAVFLMDHEQQCIYANTAAEELTGYRFEQMQGRPLHDVVHHKKPDGSHYPLAECPIDRAFPERAQMSGEELFVAPDGSFYPVGFTASPLLDEDGRPIGTVIEARNIADEKARDIALRDESSALETLNRVGAALAGDLDLERVVQKVTDAGVELTGAQFGAYFHNVFDESGERLSLYTLSGARRSDFEAFGKPRPTDIFGPTFRNEGVIRSADILVDPRYGNNAPHKGMPEGHLPVRSYLAVSVVSRSGEVLGGLLFGHPEPGRFSERHERLMVGLAAQAAIAVDNARLYKAAQEEIAERARAEERLRDLNETLEERVASEVAERAKTEAALRQSQKMESVGQLTGGIAHDFNNLLTVVVGNIDMGLRALEAAGGDPRVRRALDNAQKGAERAASLTQRLLAFSRRQPLAPKPMDVDKLVVGMSDLLNRALGETVLLEVVTSPGLWRVEADPNQLESAILNLAVNARDAMPQGGELTIETANARLDDAYSADHAEVAPGQYVVIAVTDTGEGMPKELLDKVFEPFFTTKEVGKGTGLGLSMVYGFVKQSGGHIKIYSEEGRGTTVKIYLPRLLSQDIPEEEAQLTPGLEVSRQAETVLVVEDDDDVRAYTVECLRELGYRVLEAHDGPSALRLMERQDRPLDLLFTDVVMPGMSGRELADAARQLQADLRVLYTSGYTRNAIVHGGRLDAGVEMIAKPFTFQALAQKVRDMLDMGQTRRILVIEDDATVRMFAAEALASAGFAVDEAATACEAINKVRASQGRYDAVVLDVRLPEKTGDSLALELRAMHADLPILLASGEYEAELRERFVADRCVGVISKPYNSVKLTEALDALGLRCGSLKRP